MNEPHTQPREQERKSFVSRLVSFRISDLVIVFFLCVLVGMVLAVLNVDPARLWVDFFGAVADAWTSFFGNLGDALGWALQYFFLGAVIIIPIWILVRVVKALSKR
jgi:succinate dehydrogenase hydrophobic anchor subunit